MEKKRDFGSLKINLMILVNCLFLSLIFIYLFGVSVNAIVGENNVTVITTLVIGNAFPEVLNVSIQGGDSDFSLIPNSTKLLSCVARIRDFDGVNDVILGGNVRAEFYDTSVSFFGDADANNHHYSNGSCELNPNGAWEGHLDDDHTLLANCTFLVEYYANPSSWNCTVLVNDSSGYEDDGNGTIVVNQLLGIGLPSFINYGEVNATMVSEEIVANVTNFGNSMFNLTLEGYAQNRGDGYAMNCSFGSYGFIDIGHEKYNLSDSTPGYLDFSNFSDFYINLTSADDVIREFNLDYRKNDLENDAVNQTYWRIYVPKGVAGSCSGNIIFGAIIAEAS